MRLCHPPNGRHCPATRRRAPVAEFWWYGCNEQNSLQMLSQTKTSIELLTSNLSSLVLSLHRSHHLWIQVLIIKIWWRRYHGHQRHHNLTFRNQTKMRRCSENVRWAFLKASRSEPKNFSGEKFRFSAIFFSAHCLHKLWVLPAVFGKMCSSFIETIEFEAREL